MSPVEEDGPAAYDGPERRRTPRDLAFERAVQAAAAIAAQRVARIHRVRLVTQSAIAAFTVAMCVAAAAGLIYRNQGRHLIRLESSQNCTLITSLASIMSSFVDSDRQVRVKQANLNAQGRLVRDLAKVVPVGDLAAVVKATSAASFTVAAAWQADERRLNQLAAVNCSSS